MSALRPGTGRSSMLVTALLLSTAYIAPAFAQVEQVIVTAQRKSEDIQNVPIAVTAFTSQDMAAHQIVMAKDLQFATPNVTYTKTNFSGDDFTIRGIGNDVITGGGESGVSVSFDNIYLAGASVALGSFYDTERVEVLEGPQSTLYGRGATAGSVNIIPNKPDLEQAYVNLDASYGNYSANEDHLAVNLPLVTDELGLRIAADREYHDGFITNDFYNNHIDGENTYSFRSTLRWEPTDATTIDFVVQTFHKNDSGMRSEKQVCLWDPSGTLGCLPNGQANNAINENAFFAADVTSTQAFGNTFAGFQPFFPYPLSAMGLTSVQNQAPLVNNPTTPWHENTDFNPTWNANDTFMALNGKQRLTNWLDLEVNVGYDHSSSVTQESYNNSAPQLLPTTLGTYAPAIPGTSTLGTFYDTVAALYGPAYASIYSQFFNHFGPGGNTLLPVSAFRGLGLNSGQIAYYTNSFSTYDQSNAEQKQYSIDFRFQSHLDGPFNFLLGGFYLRQEGWGDYFVGSGAQGYGSIALGAILGPALAPSLCLPGGCTFAPASYDNSSPATDGVTLKSQSVYGDTYYDIVPNLLKLTLGARWTDDYKSQADRILLFNGLVPIGATSFPTNPLVGGVPYQFLSQSWNKITGHAILDYTPKLDFTDQTLIYASYGRGYKAGGFNPGLSTFAIGQGVPANYNPEGIDAFEVGTKNTLLNQTLQANLDVWYYNYEGLQISQILDNDSINFNVNSRMFGSEGQLVYVPDDHWQFNFNVGYTHSALGQQYLVDPRNPTAGAPNAVLIKDDTLSATGGQNCAVFLTAGQTLTPADNPTLNAALAAAGLPTYAAPPGGSGQLAPYGIPHANFGTCDPSKIGTQKNPGLVGAILIANGYSLNQPGGIGNQNGVPVNIHGNENPNAPPWTISFGAQYTFDIGNDYTLVPRLDVYHQTQMWGRVFETPADRINGYWLLNAQIQLNAPDDFWYAQAFVKNLGDVQAVTGEYLTSSSSGLFTNQFLQDPRTYGIRVGIHF